MCETAVLLYSVIRLAMYAQAHKRNVGLMTALLPQDTPGILLGYSMRTAITCSAYSVSQMVLS